MRIAYWSGDKTNRQRQTNRNTKHPNACKFRFIRNYFSGFELFPRLMCAVLRITRLSSPHEGKMFVVILFYRNSDHLFAFINFVRHQMTSLLYLFCLREHGYMTVLLAVRTMFTFALYVLDTFLMVRRTHCKKQKNRTLKTNIKEIKWNR